MHCEYLHVKYHNLNNTHNLLTVIINLHVPCNIITVRLNFITA